MEKNNKKLLAWLMSGLFGILSGMFLVFGYQLESGDSLNLSDQNALLVLLAFFFIITVDTRHVWRNYESARNGKAKLFGLSLCYTTVTICDYRNLRHIRFSPYQQMLIIQFVK